MTLSDFVNATLWRTKNLFHQIQLFFQFRLNTARIYEPDPWRPASDAARDPRQTPARAAAILNHLPQRPLSSLDIGCHSGYFTFALARRGGFCLGIDYGRNAIMIAQAFAATHDVSNVAFAQIDIDAQTAASLPQTEVVICLSVYHHWVRKLGRAGAEEIMRTLASRATKYLVFDTGQPDEVIADWARTLSFMEPDIDSFLRQFLRDLGFASVSHLGTFKTSLSAVPRHLYIAARTG